MNKARRNKLSDALDYLSMARIMIRDIQEEEQESYDNMPESLQCSKKGDAMEYNIDKLSDVADCIEEQEDGLREVIE